MEKIIELLEKIAEIRYPIFIEKGEDTLPILNKTFQSYSDILNEYDGDTLIDQIKPSINSLKEKLLNIHDSYINGFYKKSYILTDELIIEFKEKINIRDIPSNENECLYRSRTQKPHISLQSDEMSHISYKKRHIVGSNRFSAPGTPCLYLASSSYLCWLEAGRPSNNTFNVCAFRPKVKMDILDLTSVAENLLDEIVFFVNEKGALDSKENLSDEYEKRLKKEVPKKEIEIPIKIEKFLHTWLIALACGIKVKEHDEKNRAFKEEYVIPQLLLQSLIQNQIDGIKYISTNISVSTKNRKRLRFINYAFPAKGDDKKLISYFLTSSVINAASCQGVTTLREDIQKISKFINDLYGFNRSSQVRLPSNCQVEMMPYSSGTGGFSYWDSVFGEIEQTLRDELRGKI